MQPRVLDISHHNTVGAAGFDAVAGAGIWGIIHKATQGKAYADPDYVSRRFGVHSAGLLFGAYHFATGDDVKAQVDWVLLRAKPDDKTLMVLDFEDNRLSQMSIAQALEFLHLLESRLGRPAAIYSGNRLKEHMGDLRKGDRDYLTSHRLWLAQYGQHPKLPVGFNKLWLHQYTDGIYNKDKTPLPGITGQLDRNAYAGTRDQLIKEWG